MPVFGCLILYYQAIRPSVCISPTVPFIVPELPKKKKLARRAGANEPVKLFFSGNEPVKLFSMTVAFSYRTQARQYSKNDDLSIPFHF